MPIIVALLLTIIVTIAIISLLLIIIALIVIIVLLLRHGCRYYHSADRCLTTLLTPATGVVIRGAASPPSTRVPRRRAIYLQTRQQGSPILLEQMSS